MAWVYHSGRICGEGELRCVGVVVCVMVAVYRDCSLWYFGLWGLRCGGVVVCEGHGGYQTLIY